MYQRQVSFTEAISKAMSNYATFSGRASRSEYWWFELFMIIIQSVLSALSTATGDPSPIFMGISGLVSLVLFLPSLSVSVRRLHDIGKGGGWIFINLIPLVGNIIYLVWMCKNSEFSDNRFGPVPNVVE